MLVTREDLNPCTIKLTVVCEPEEVKHGFDTAFRKLTKKVRVPGFRPGKAPKGMLEQFVGGQELAEAAADEIVLKAYPKAVEQEQLEIDRTTMPQLSVSAIDKEEAKCEFVAKVPLPPKVELGDYKSLPVEQPSAEVTESEIDFQISELRRRGGTHGAVTDRGVEEGDMAVLNLKPEGVEGDGRNFMTSAGQTFPQLDAAIMGMRVEEIKNLLLTFPEDFQEKDWAGKNYEVQVTLNSLSGIQLPELDDSFAQSLNTENVDELRNKLREAIGVAKQQMVRQMVYEKLVDELMTRSQVAVSDNMWENLANRRLTELAQEQADNGKSLEKYAIENGMSLEQFAQAWRDKAKLEVERALLIQAVFSGEKMSVVEDDLRQELVSFSKELNMSPVEVFEIMSKNNTLEELHFRALSRKVGDFLLASAEVTVASA
jgi:trigger factor